MRATIDRPAFRRPLFDGQGKPLLDDKGRPDGFNMTVYDLRSERGAWAETRFPFGAERHGFAVVDAVGDLVACRPGHNYGARQIAHDLQRIVSHGTAWPRTEPATARK